MRRRTTRRSAGRRRTVAWLDGLTGLNTVTPLVAKIMTFAQPNAAVVPNTWSVVIQLTTDADLTLHGGEDAVLVRIRGRLLFYGGQITAAGGAGPLLCRSLIYVADVNPTGQVLGLDHTTSAGLGRDDIMWTRDHLITATTVLGNGSGASTETGTLNDYWVDVDVKAKRKVSQGFHVFFETTSVGTGASQPNQFLLGGSLRMLMMRPK